MTTSVTDTELLQDLRAGPTGKKLIREREERRLAERKEWAREIEKLTTVHLKTLPDLNSAADAAAEKVKAAQKAVEEAQEGWRLAETARRNAATRFDSQREGLEVKLRGSAPPEIAHFIKGCADSGALGSHGARLHGRHCGLSARRGQL